MSRGVLKRSLSPSEGARRRKRLVAPWAYRTRLVLYLLAALAVASVTWWLSDFRPRKSTGYIESLIPDSEEWQSRLTATRQQGGAPHTTMVIVFKGQKPHAYTRYYLDSVRRQTNVDLVIIHRGPHCGSFTELVAGAENIQYVCMSEENFWMKHVDYFCGHWDNCTNTDRDDLHSDFMTFGTLLGPHAYFPLFRGFVFADYVSPKSTFWAYGDMDIALGDFETVFPWDVATRFDVISTTEGHKMGGERTLIYTRGHLTLFRFSEATEAKLLDWQPLKSPSDFQWFGSLELASEEGIWSSLLVAKSGIDFLAFDGMAPGSAVTSSSNIGVMTLPEWPTRPQPGELPVLPKELAVALTDWSATNLRPTFTRNGIEKQVKVHQGIFEATPKELDLWFSTEYANWYTSLAAPLRTGFKRYLYRQQEVWRERLEPVRDWATDTVLEGSQAWVYVHFQEEKRKSHFTELTGVNCDIFINYLYDGNAGFSAAGDLVFWEARRQQDCDYVGCVDPGMPLPAAEPAYIEYLWRQYEAERQFDAKKRQRLGYFDNPELPLRLARPEWWL